MKDFKNLIKQKENGGRKGFDSKSKTWKPHESAEGGTDTIGWGHKLTTAEQAGGYVIIGEEKVPFAQLTEDKNNILFEQDWARKSQDAAKFINEKGDWNSLTEPQKLVSTELFYNLGNKATQYKNFRDKILTPNSNFIEEIDRSYTDTKGKKRSLTERTDPIKAWYKEQEKAPKNAPGVNPFEAQLQTAENAALISNFGAPKPKEVITDTETITEKGPGFIDRFTSGFKELYPFNEGGPVEQQIITENIDVSEPDMRKNYRMQEAARRSMMQGNEEERMADYEDALFQSGIGGMAGNPYYPARIVEPTPPPMQAAQRMMGGRMRYAQGGTVDQAQGLASLGRGGDSTLVHMQPQEVAGLQQLAQSNGTSLTRNPMTGYPEAFRLGGVLKAAAPIAAGYFLGPAAGLAMGTTAATGAIAAGAVTGAGIAAASGEDVAMGAVSGGLGGMSGGGLEGAFAGVGDAFAGNVASTVPQTATNAIGGANLTTAGGKGLASATGNMGNIGGSALTTQGGAGFAPPDFGMTNATMPGNVGTSTPGGFKAGYNKFMDNVSNITATDEILPSTRELSTGIDPKTGEYIRKTGERIPGSFLAKAKTIGTPIASLGLGGLEQSDFISEPDFDDPRDKYNPYSKLNLSNDTGISESLAADTGLRLFAEGGNVAGDQKQALNLNSGSNVAGNNAGLRGLNLDTGMTGVSAADLAAAAMARRMTSTPGQNVGGSTNQPFTVPTRKEYGTGGPNEVPEDFIGGLGTNYNQDIAGNFRRKAQGGIIRGYAEGGYLQGPGDGMSDDIPATINGDEPAALADGEFVVPADVVSHLGNGSSEAGSKQLYAMMDRIRKARTGRESQGKEIKPGKYMPS